MAILGGCSWLSWFEATPQPWYIIWWFIAIPKSLLNKDLTGTKNAVTYAMPSQTMMVMVTTLTSTPIGAEMLYIGNSFSTCSMQQPAFHSSTHRPTVKLFLTRIVVPVPTFDLRLTTVSDFIGINGATPLTRIPGFTPWRTFLCSEGCEIVCCC